MSSQTSPKPNPDPRDARLNLITIVASLIALLGAIALLAPGFIFVLALALSDESETLIEETPTGSKLGLLVQNDGAWIYSSHDISIYQTGQRRNQLILSTRLANDGANLSPENVQLQWQSKAEAILRLDGEEQDPTCHRLKLGQAPESEAIACPPSDP